jgi:hypothetical protein
MGHLLPASFFHWSVTTPLARWVNKSLWGFAILETFHIIGLTVLLGTVFVANLSVLRFGTRQSTSELARELAPWMVAGLVLMIGSGVPMFMSSAVGYSSSIPFFIKMTLLVSAIVLQVAMYKIPSLSERATFGKLAACLSLVCWFGVAYAGRAISFEILFDFSSLMLASLGALAGVIALMLVVGLSVLASRRRTAGQLED